MLALLLVACFSPNLQEPNQPLPLRLEDLVRLVQANGPTIQQAQLSALATRGGMEEAAGRFDPVFFSDLSYSYLEQPLSGFFSNAFPELDEQESTALNASQGIRGLLASGGTYTLSLHEDDTSANYLNENQANASLRFQFTQPLLRGGWNMVGTQALRTAELSHQSALASVQRATRESVQTAIDSYWDLAFALEDAEVKEFGLKMAEELRQVTQARFEVGAVAEVEVVQTEADIASRTDALLTAKHRVLQTQDSLRLAISGMATNQDWNQSYVPSSPLPIPAPSSISWQSAFEVALELRPQLEELRFTVKQATLDWEVAKQNQGPKLDFTSAGNSYGQDTGWQRSVHPIWDFDSPGYTFGLVLEIPLGNRQFEGAEMKARHTLALAERRLRDGENQVASEVRDAVRSVNYLAERVAATRLASKVAGRQLEAEERRLQEGISTNFQVLEFQNDLLTARTAELGAHMAYAKAVTQLNSSQGLPWDGSPPQ